MDSTKFPTMPTNWAAQLSGASTDSTGNMGAGSTNEVSGAEFDLFTVLNSDDPKVKAQLLEQVVALELKYKKILDQGVAPAEFARLNGIYQACGCARAILES